MASQKCFLRPPCVFIPASEEEGGVFFCCSKPMLDNHRQQVNCLWPAECMKEDQSAPRILPKLQSETSVSHQDRMDVFGQNNIKNTKQHTLDSKCSSTNIQKQPWVQVGGPVRRLMSYWEPQTFRDFSKTRPTLSHEVHLQPNTQNRQPRTQAGGHMEDRAELSILGIENSQTEFFLTRSATVTEYRSSRKT